jgi:DNA repair exonuclease SbcCD ATPase subunit
MIIQELEWKNFKSFGEVVQKITFSPNGELILLAGKNGSGKTAIKDAIEYALFGKISGKKKKFLAIKKAINRINSTNLRVGIKFLNNNNQFISITRNAEPNILKVLIDNEDKSENFSNFSDKEKDKIIGFTYEIFKSFISMSMKNFEDFLQLTDAKKEELLNKLFQLEDLIAIQNLVKELYTNNNQVYQFQIKRLDVLKKEIVNLKEIITALPDITDIDLKLENLKKNINSYKEPFILKQNQFKNAKEKLFEFNKKIQEGSPLKIDYEKQMQKVTWEQEQQESRLKLFEQGKCPYCLTNLTDDDHQEELIKLKEEIRLNGIKINEFKISIDECVLEEAKIINQQKYWKTQYIQITDEFIKLQNEIKSKKEEYKVLETRKNENINVQQLKDQFNKSAEEYRGIRNQVEKLIKKKEHYEILLELFKGTTLRQHMINQMLPSVNFYLKDFL